MMSFRKIFFSTALLIIATGWSGCKKFVEVKTPGTSVNEGNVYKSDNTAIAVLTTLYAKTSSSNFGGTSGVSLTSGLSADELTLAGVVAENGLNAFYKNQLRSSLDGNFGVELWRGLYDRLFTCNAAIEGLDNSTSLTPAVKAQLLGEAKFLRAFYYFYLVNYYGDVPLVLTTNPNVNGKLPRTAKQKVYEQIVIDLKDAQNLLSSSFLDASLLRSTSERVRPTKWVATALLARVYLYLAQYANAEAEAGKVIANTTQFSFVPLNAVFLKNSNEAIWQLQPVETGRNTEDAISFVLPPSGPNASTNPVYLSPQQLAAFEAGDLRRKGGNWVDSVIAGAVTYYYPAKYKATTISGSAFTEYLMMFRLAEQYLIRAEARAKQNNIPGAKDDMNVIRTRAGLLNATANDQATLLTAILKERQVELFTEMGHRWLDLKRTGNVDAVMTVVTPLKSGGDVWKSYQQLYPILFYDIQLNPNLVQNAGY